MKLYEFAILYIPDAKAKKDGERPKILVEPQYVLAPDDHSAGLLAGRQIPEAFLDRLDQVQVPVRPF
ncbi:MAG: hypothetical protein ACYTG6_14450 [Planctomycetota bacterium]|jgi:hypothetical protein